MALGKKGKAEAGKPVATEEKKQRPAGSLIVEENGEKVLVTAIWGKIDSKGCVNLRYYTKDGEDETIISVRLDGGALANAINAPSPEGDAE